jgi:hypothetical protein
MSNLHAVKQHEAIRTIARKHVSQLAPWSDSHESAVGGNDRRANGPYR